MNFKQKKRLIWLTSMLIGVGLSVSLILYALNKNINLYFTPKQIPKHLPLHTLRLGGLVRSGSLKRTPDSLTMQFIITDLTKDVTVIYTGIVPSLFREGQGVVVEGQFNPNGIFKANQVLAKHDENYMPPNIKAKSRTR